MASCCCDSGKQARRCEAAGGGVGLRLLGGARAAGGEGGGDRQGAEHGGGEEARCVDGERRLRQDRGILVQALVEGVGGFARGGQGNGVVGHQALEVFQAPGRQQR